MGWLCAGWLCAGVAMCWGGFAAGCYFERASTNLVDFLDKQIIILVCSWLRPAGNASQGVSIYFIINVIVFRKSSRANAMHTLSL